MVPDDSDFHQNYIDLMIRHSITALDLQKIVDYSAIIRSSIFDEIDFQCFSCNHTFTMK